MKITKKAFKELLNDKYSAKGTGWNRQSGARTRPYGDWLYSADKVRFDMDYNEFLKTNILP